ncbi:MAG TPA: hypothetical protein VGG45_03825 [Terracidiphilus sp.]|jgi:hypothetical protein
MAPSATPDKLKLIALVPAVAQPALIAVADPQLRPLANLEPQFSSPPRYILNQAFRI